MTEERKGGRRHCMIRRTKVAKQKWLNFQSYRSCQASEVIKLSTFTKHKTTTPATHVMYTPYDFRLLCCSHYTTFCVVIVRLGAIAVCKLCDWSAESEPQTTRSVTRRNPQRCLSGFLTMFSHESMREKMWRGKMQEHTRDRTPAIQTVCVLTDDSRSISAGVSHDGEGWAI